ncbi:flagellar protein FlaG [Ketobacter sp.]|uniref:flagellar protein FlaG n=1 Tax=Ketobacter sp. TaxID=2083498 RepID=UPI0025B8B0B1|nr:flagellar protein FlaG [Ketobacter sp.]
MISDKPLNADLNLTVKDLSGVASRNRARDQVDSDGIQQVSQTDTKAAEAAGNSISKEISREIEARVDKDVEQVQKEELKKKVNEAIPKVRELMQRNQRSLDFKVAEHENRIVITVIDEENDKVIRQIPPEDVLKIAASIDQGLELHGGSILNDKA